LISQKVKIVTGTGFEHSGPQPWFWIKNVMSIGTSQQLATQCYWSALVSMQNQKLFFSLGPHKGRSSYMRSLWPSKESFRHFKTRHSFTFL